VTATARAAALARAPFRAVVTLYDEVSNPNPNPNPNRNPLTLTLIPTPTLTPTLTLTLTLTLALTLYDEATALLARSARWVLPFFFTAWGCAVQSGRLQLLRDAPRAIIFLLPLYWAEVRVRARD